MDFKKLIPKNFMDMDMLKAADSQNNLELESSGKICFIRCQNL